LFQDYRAVERAYFKRTGLFPAHHLVGIRRTVVEEHPWIAHSLYDALVRASAKSHETRWRLTDISPWTLTELEETAAVFGDNWNPSGVAANRKMIEAFCEEQWTQGLVERKVDPSTVFADFERLSAEAV
jgi:4,5-dihydroxyphthalate decarboxylase